jgi:hypothetical protein
MTLRKDGIDCMARVKAARDILTSGPRDLDEKLDRGAPGPEDGLHIGETLPSDRCHLNNAAVRINRHHRDHAAIGEEHMVERAIRVHQDLRALAANLFKLRHKPIEIARRQREQQPIARPI